MVTRQGVGNALRRGRPRVDRALRLARLAAPLAFLLAVTGVVLVVRSSLGGETPARGTATAPAARTHPAKRAPQPVTPKRWYVIASGDTLGAIAARFATTVDDLLKLNPGIQPTALHPGQQLRIR